MNSEEKFWLTLWLSLFIAITICVVTVTIQYTKQTENYVSNGYQEIMTPGGRTSVWQKISTIKGK